MNSQRENMQSENKITTRAKSTLTARDNMQTSNNTTVKTKTVLFDSSSVDSYRDAPKFGGKAEGTTFGAKKESQGSDSTKG